MRMKKSWLIGAVVVLVLLLAGLIVKAKFFSRPALGAISISSTPKAVVFIDGVQMGMTPFFSDEIEAGEHTIKLVPEATTDSLVSWEKKVNLVPNILTAINRHLGSSESSSSGETLSLEKISSRDQSALAVISIPDQAVVKIDGAPKGFAPVTVENLTPGNYQITVASPGYEEKMISAKTVAGYKLIVNVQLAQKIEGIEEATESGEVEEKEEEAEASPTPAAKTSPQPTPPEKPYVKIKETPTGWLRVRMAPSTAATEAAKINPGEMYPYLNEEKNGWYKIEYEKGEEGWISGVYAELIK